MDIMTFRLSRARQKYIVAIAKLASSMRIGRIPTARGSFCRDNMHSMSFRRRVYGNASSLPRRVFVNRNRHRRRNRGKYTSIYITAGCWLVTLSRTADDSMICRSVTVPCQIYPAAVLAGALTRKTPGRSFAIGALTRVVTLDYQSAAIVMRRRFVLRHAPR